MYLEQKHKPRSKNTNPDIKIQKLKISKSPFSQTLQNLQILKPQSIKSIQKYNTIVNHKDFYPKPSTTSFVSQLSRPKPDTRICDHDWHANIKPKPDINKNHLTFTKLLPKAFLFFSILVSLLKLYNL